FQLRCELLAGTAPRRPEIDQHRLFARFLDDVGRKSSRRGVLDQVSGGWCGAQCRLGGLGAAILHGGGVLAGIAAELAAKRIVVVAHVVALPVAPLASGAGATSMLEVSFRHPCGDHAETFK